MNREFLGGISVLVTHYATIAASATYTDGGAIPLKDYGFPQRVTLFLAGDLGASADVDAKVQCDATGSYADITNATASLAADGQATSVEVEIPAGSSNIKVLARSQTADSEVSAGVVLGAKSYRTS